MEPSERKNAIENLIITTMKQSNNITEEQVNLIKELYAEDDRKLEDIEQELLSYFASISQINMRSSMKNSSDGITYSLNIETATRGIYLGETQIDLMSLTEISCFNELLEFIKKCYQVDYSELELKQLQKMKIDTAKRKVFADYKDTLIGATDLKKDPSIILRRKLCRLGLAYDKIDEVIALYKANDIEQATNHIIQSSSLDLETIARKNFKMQSLDFDNVKCSSYEELEALTKKISNFDRITITSGEYGSVICNGVFDPYHIERELAFCKKHNIHTRYHCLLSQSTLEHFKGKSKKEIVENLRQYILATIEYINKYNAENKLSDGRPLINAVDIFDELINLKKDKSREAGYYNIFESLGLTIEDLVDILAPAIGNKQDGVEYIYNEAFVETKEKRDIQLSLAAHIHSLAPKLIDTFGTQMHITTDFKEQTFLETFTALKKFSDETGIKLAITEFDMHIPEKTLAILKRSGKNTREIADYVSFIKLKKLAIIAKAAESTGIEFTEIGYCSPTNSMYNNKKSQGLSTLYGGLFGHTLEPKAIQEVVEYTPFLKRPSGTSEVLGYYNTLNNLLERQSAIMPQDYVSKASEQDKKLIKRDSTLYQTGNQDDSGFANFPQLLIMSLLLIGLLYILLM